MSASVRAAELSAHHAVFNVAIVPTVEKPDRDVNFRESVRDGRRKKIFENPEPEHYFHLEYQLLPDESGGQVFKTDVVCFGVVSKIFTERDTRVVQCWNESDGLNYFGWRHKHHVKVSRALLLELYKHTLVLRIWNIKSKLSARARYDQPKAFRLPAASKSHHEEIVSGPLIRQPSKLCLVSHEQTKAVGGRKRTKQSSSLSLHADTDSDTSVIEQPISPAASPRQLEPAIPEEGITYDCSALNLQTLPSTTQQLGLSPCGRKRTDNGTEEQARVDKEGLTVLRIRMSDLFAKSTIASASMDTPIKNLRGLEVSVSVQGSLMPVDLLRELNPLTITVSRLTSLPSSPLTHLTLKHNCEPVYVKYKFHGQPAYQTPSLPQADSLEWQDSHTILLGTIPSDQLLEYLRGPPLIMELHDRDLKSINTTLPAVFGRENNDHSIGTHAFGTKSCDVENDAVECADPYGVARIDLTGLLAGQKVIEVSAAVVNGPKVVGVVTTPPGDYLESHCELRVKAELTHPLSLPVPSKQKPATFTRLVYVMSSEGNSLVERILGLVNEVNAKVLQLSHLPANLLPCALSTYKLTKDEMSRDVITGFHVKDGEMSVLVLEGLQGKAVHRVWSEVPRHPSQDSGLVKVFYNSQFAFCDRLYSSLDVDLPCIQLYQPLSSLLQNSLLYISGALPPHCFRSLMCLSELSLVSEMSDLTRNDLFPTALEVTALSMHFGVPTSSHTTHNQSPDPAHSQSPDNAPSRQKIVWKPLDLSNPLYERYIKEKQTGNRDFMGRNILHVAELSKQSALSRPRKRRSRSLSDGEATAHIYSSQTYNSSQLAAARLQRQLDPRQRYTYCQHYHSMTLEPGNTNKVELRRRWRTADGFAYPGVASSIECNMHKSKPHPTRVQDLTSPFQDNLLHANTLKPSVDRLHFSWEERARDFEHYKALPLTSPGTQPPSTIHLAGQSRDRELLHSTVLAEEEWKQRLVVADTDFHVHRKGMKTELTSSGPKASSQLDKLKGMLKDPAVKYTLKSQGFTLEDIPALSAVHNHSTGADEDTPMRGYLPGPSTTRSLKLDSNVIPITKKTSTLNTHSESFRLHNPSQGTSVVL